MRKTFNSSAEYYIYMSIKRMVKNGVRYGNVWNLWKNTNWFNIITEETLNKWWKEAEKLYY